MRRRHSPEQVIRDLIREINSPAEIEQWSQLIPYMLLPTLDLTQDEEEDDDTVDTGSPIVTSGRPVDASLDAVIIGDSQSGGPLGNTIKKRLEEMGYAVRKTHEDGASGDVILNDQMPDVSQMPDILVAIFGGNDFSVQSAVEAAKEMYRTTSGVGTYLVIVGPPQATTITDPTSAGQVFASTLGPNPEPNAWFTRDGGTYVERRLDIAQALEEEFAGMPNVSVYGIGAHMIPVGGIGVGETYPDQPDGLHIVAGVDRVVDNILRAIDISEITRNIRDRLSPDQQVSVPAGPLVAFDYDRWIREISKIEGNYKSVNKDSAALGKYQFVPSYWWDDIKEFAGTRLSDTHEVTGYTPNGKPIYSDYVEFLNDPQLQEDWMRHYTMTKVIPSIKSIRQEFPEKTANRSDGQLAALYHFQGPQGARDWLAYGVMRGSKENAITPDQYMDRIT